MQYFFYWGGPFQFAIGAVSKGFAMEINCGSSLLLAVCYWECQYAIGGGGRFGGPPLSLFAGLAGGAAGDTKGSWGGFGGRASSEPELQ